MKIGDSLLPKRPGYGKLGRPVVLWTNYLELKELQKDVRLYRYSVTISPESDELQARKNKRLIRQLLMLEPFTKVATASDWAQTIITSKKLDLTGDPQHFTIEWFPMDGEPLPVHTTDEPQGITDRRKRNTYGLRVKYTDTVSLGDLAKDLGNSTVTYSAKVRKYVIVNLRPFLTSRAMVLGFRETR
jgi:eukaryotic translation initiation factor 2C